MDTYFAKDNILNDSQPLSYSAFITTSFGKSYNVNYKSRKLKLGDIVQFAQCLTASNGELEVGLYSLYS